MDKPIPKPRKLRNTDAGTRNQNHASVESVPLPIVPPVPKPRKLVNTAANTTQPNESSLFIDPTPGVTELGKTSSDTLEDDIDFASIPSTATQLDPKRGTVNLFHLAKLQDPFDKEFEISIQSSEHQVFSSSTVSSSEHISNSELTNSGSPEGLNELNSEASSEEEDDKNHDGEITLKYNIRPYNDFESSSSTDNPGGKISSGVVTKASLVREILVDNHKGTSRLYPSLPELTESECKRKTFESTSERNLSASDGSSQKHISHDSALRRPCVNDANSSQLLNTKSQQQNNLGSRDKDLNIIQNERNQEYEKPWSYPMVKYGAEEDESKLKRSLPVSSPSKNLINNREYDLVAAENISECPKSSLKPKSSFRSVIAEFDPLLHTHTPQKLDTVEDKSTSEDDHRYEYIDEDGSISSSCSSNNDAVGDSKEQPSESIEAQKTTKKIPEYPCLPHEEGQGSYEPIDTPSYSNITITKQTEEKEGEEAPIEDDVFQTQTPNVTPPPTLNQTGFLRKLSSKFRNQSTSWETNFEWRVNADLCYATNVFKSGGLTGRENVRRRLILARGMLSVNTDKGQLLREFHVYKVSLIFTKSDQKNKAHINFTAKGQNYQFVVELKTTQAEWISKYVESLSLLPHSLDYSRAGLAFVKESVTSGWLRSLLVIRGRSLLYVRLDLQTLDCHEMDLRKLRSIQCSSKDEDQRCGRLDSQQVLTLDFVTKFLYVQTETDKITLSWQKVLQELATTNGKEFHEMQLTVDNVPVIVEKCINFLYGHGTLAEGIYRQNGSNSRIAHLLKELENDAWSITLDPKDYSAHDVAGTLRRFFRNLPEPIVTEKLYDEFCRTSRLTTMADKIQRYADLLEKLPEINYNTLKQVVCHLFAVHELHEKNLMPLQNLASIWGPTLLHRQEGGSYEISGTESEVVKDLIENYYTLFRVGSQEIAREKKMQDALENFHLGSCRRKRSGDMKIWIYLWEKDESSAINVTVTPSTTATGLLAELKPRPDPPYNIYEVLCGGALERPLGGKEKLMDNVLRWSVWSLEERRKNYLIVKRPFFQPSSSSKEHITGEVRFADSRSKTFRKLQFSFVHPILSANKDKTLVWNVNEIHIYIGCDPIRSSPTRWSLTWLKKEFSWTRGREEPYFGNTMWLSSKEELDRWISALHANNQSL